MAQKAADQKRMNTCRLRGKPYFSGVTGFPPHPFSVSMFRFYFQSQSRYRLFGVFFAFLETHKNQTVILGYGLIRFQGVVL